MNRTNLIFTVILLVSQQVIAQKEITVLANSKEIGKNHITGDPVLANEYIFPETIRNFQIDTINNYLTVQIRGLSKNGKWLDNKGDVVRYDKEDKKVLWSEKVNFQIENIEQYGGVTLHTIGGKSYCLDNDTGERIWEIKNSLIFVDPVKKIGIGYKIRASKGSENMLEGIDLTNGKPIWQREISREYSWNGVSHLNDSTLLISAAGLHSLNIFNGAGWDYNTVTGKKDHTASAIGTGLGIAAGLLTGTYAVSTGHDLVRDVVSNVIVDSLNIYFASKKHLVNLSRKGEVVWQKSLPSDMTSRSWIFRLGNDLIMVNRGYAYMGSRQLEFGTPFIASFNIHTGEENYLETVTTEKKDMIKGIDQRNAELLFLFNDHISKYSVKDGKLINDRKFNIEGYGELNNFIGELGFIKKDLLFVGLSKLNPNKHYLYTTNGKVLILNSGLEIEGEMDAGDIYIHYLNRNGKKFIAKGNQTYMIDGEGNKIAEFSASSSATFFNGKLYEAQEPSFLEINLKSITDNVP